MKEVFGPVTGFKILEGPEGSPKRLELKIDISGIEQSILKGFRTERTSHPFDQVNAIAENSNLVLTLSGKRYILQTKNPGRLITKIDEFKTKAQKNKTTHTFKGTGMRCIVCGNEQANSTCKQCGGKVCPSHSNYVNGVNYCHSCLVLCPRCKSIHLSSHKGGFKTGSAVLGWAFGGVIIGALLGTIGMNDVELFCHTCGHKWRPTI